MPRCYLTLDNSSGAADISGQFFTLAGASRGDRARTIGVEQYLRWQRDEAEKLGGNPKAEKSGGEKYAPKPQRQKNPGQKNKK